MVITLANRSIINTTPTYAMDEVAGTDSGSLSLLSDEFRLMIFDCLVHDGCSLASLAAVSLEWQSVVEHHNFARLTLTPSRLSAFELIAQRKRALIRYIWLRIELEDDSRSIRLRVSSVNDGLLQTVFESLFSALSGWKPDDGNLTLDISVHSPAESKSCFANMTSNSDLAPLQCRQDKKTEKLVPVVAPAPTKNSLEWAFDWILSQNLEKQRLPLVPAIASVLVRQQNRQQWSPLTLGVLFSCLPRLQQIHYEPWRQWDKDSQEFQDSCE